MVRHLDSLPSGIAPADILPIDESGGFRVAEFGEDM